MYHRHLDMELLPYHVVQTLVSLWCVSSDLHGGTVLLLLTLDLTHSSVFEHMARVVLPRWISGIEHFFYCMDRNG